MYLILPIIEILGGSHTIKNTHPTISYNITPGLSKAKAGRKK